MRYFLEIAYEGSAFYGWQIQAQGPTVQAEVERTLQILLQKKTPCIGCGRTDTGVHATQFFLHFDTEQEIENPSQFVWKFNQIISPSIVAYKLFLVQNDAHARFSAISRKYKYYISLEKNPFLKGKAAFINYLPNLDAMQNACKYFVGIHDYKAFSKKNDLNSHQCEVFLASLSKEENCLVFEVSANRFLRNMVRAMVGTLLDVGKGKINASDILSILQSKERANAGESVPAEGLFLANIAYPESIFNS
jgi:tRNA pseudouridine38-40 synthase